MSSYEPDEPPDGVVPRIVEGAEAEQLMASMGIEFFNPSDSDPNKPNNPNSITKKLMKKAKKGNVRAMYELGMAYWRGTGGLRVNRELAESTFKQAAMKGEVNAMFNLGQMLELDSTLEDDPSSSLNKAKLWYQKCSDASNGRHEQQQQMARQALDKIDQKLNIGQYAPVERVIETCGSCGTEQTKEKKLKACKCHKQFYCSSSCQRANWIEHKSACKAARKVDKKQFKQAIKKAKSSTSSTDNGKTHALTCEKCTTKFVANTNINGINSGLSFTTCCAAFLCWDCGDRYLAKKSSPYCSLCQKKIPSTAGQSLKSLLKLSKRDDDVSLQLQLPGFIEGIIAGKFCHSFLLCLILCEIFMLSV